MNSDWDTLYLLVNLSNKKIWGFFLLLLLFCFVLFFCICTRFTRKMREMNIYQR